MKRPFVVNPELTAIAIGYNNKKLIADQIMPKVPVGKKDFKYMYYPPEQRLTIPDTKVGRKSKPNVVEFGAEQRTASCEDFGLDDPIPQDDIDQAPKNYDPKGTAVEGITALIELDREVRVASMLNDPANFAHSLPLSGTDKFSDFTNSDPIETILEALDAMLMRANVMVIGRAAFSVLQRHPMLLKAINTSGADAGLVRREAIRDLFELEDLLVGESYVNTARKGQNATLERTWGTNIQLLYRDRLATTQIGMTYGITAQYGDRIASELDDPDIGLRGGVRVRAGESVGELITAPECGYLLETVI